MTRLLWLDLETTGLDPLKDLILEIGFVVTEGLDRIMDSESIVIDHGAVHLHPDVLNMHLENGLLQDIGKRGVTPAEAHVQATRFIDGWFPNHDEPIIVGGSGIDRFDLPFIRAAAWPLSSMSDGFHYGTLDTSGLKRLAKMAGHDIAGRGGATHRAVEDATDSFKLARTFARMLEVVGSPFPTALQVEP